MKINIIVGPVTLDAELNDSSTARQIAEILPFESSFDTWGDEIYFTVPVKADLDDSARDVVAVGDLAYWPTGQAFCIFFGPTLMSQNGEIRPASAVNIIGKVRSDVKQLKSVMHQERLSIKIRSEK